MQQFTADQLRAIGSAVFMAAGAPPDTADFVAGSLVESNLMGHDSHGILRVMQYVEDIENGRLIPEAYPTTIKETDTTALVGGNWAFGQVAARFGAEVAIEKAKKSQVAAVGIVQLNHVGRLGEWTAMMAEAGMVGIVTTGGWRPPIAGVTPFGGRGRALGTNPYSFAVPTRERDMVLVDFATAMMAEGKLRVARAKGTPLPPGVILDKEGKPSTNADDFYAGGVILPFGGHKGYALNLLADLLGALLPGADTFGSKENETGTLVLAINVEAFRPLADFAEVVDRRLGEIKAVSPAIGCDEVMIPGEPEIRTREERTRAGIALPDATWEALVETGLNLGIDVRQIAGE